MKPWDDIVLTEEEKEAAIVEGKKRKYFHEKNREYWDGLEKPNKATQKTAKRVAELVAQDVRGILAKHSQVNHNIGADTVPSLIL